MQETLVVRRERHIPAPPAAARRFGLFSWAIHKQVLEDELAFTAVQRPPR